MKFSEFFTAPTMRAAALRIGITVGAIMAIFTQMDWRYAILIGAVVALLASVILPLAMYITVDAPMESPFNTISQLLR